MERLVESQVGPRYFQPEPDTKLDEQGVLWLDSTKANEQLPRILGERKWGDSEKDKVMKLVEETSEPHPSRVVGGRRINLAKLNVALDELP
ncbi:potassium-transporting ATPase subunit C [Luteolibacter sp. Populi]|uniref:potassium-transporting ATPase subunit C n=1 Tax=Luteolibacter sp. Populi TaxID=3230487 RepID=UPI003467CF17